MPALGNDVLANVIAALALVVVGWLARAPLLIPFVFRRRRRMLQFFGLTREHPNPLVYLSTLFVQRGGSVDFRGTSRTFAGSARSENTSDRMFSARPTIPSERPIGSCAALGRYRRRIRAVGIDLAAEPAGTAVAVIDWAADQATVCDLIAGADDHVIVDAITTADKAGLDCPLGWPEEFIAFLSAQRLGGLVMPSDIAGRDWRRRLAYRITDKAVQTSTGPVLSS